MFFCKLYKILKNTYFAEDLLLKYFFFQNIKKWRLDQFQTNGSFRYPLKASENQKFSDDVRREKTETSVLRKQVK